MADDEDDVLAALVEAEDDAPVVRRRVLNKSIEENVARAASPPRERSKRPDEDALERLKEARKKPARVPSIAAAAAPSSPPEAEEVTAAEAAAEEAADGDSEEPPGEDLFAEEKSGGSSSDDDDEAAAAEDDDLADFIVKDEDDDGAEDALEGSKEGEAAAAAEAAEPDEEITGSFADRATELRAALVVCTNMIAALVIDPDETARVLADKRLREQVGLTRRVITLFNLPAARGESMVDSRLRCEDLLGAIRRRPFARVTKLSRVIGSTEAPVKCECCSTPLHKCGAGEVTAELALFGEPYDRDAVASLGARCRGTSLIGEILSQRGWYRFMEEVGAVLPPAGDDVQVFRVHQGCARRLQTYSRCIHNTLRMACSIHSRVDRIRGSATMRAEVFAADAVFHNDLFTFIADMIEESSSTLPIGGTMV